MRSALVIVFVMLVWCDPASAKLIPYYRMDSLAYLATDIILCDELEENERRHGQATFEFPTVTISVVRVLKGNLTPGERLTFEVAAYDRVLLESAPTPHPRPKIPLGRAVYFLEKKFKGDYEPVTGGVKPIYNGEAHCYGQFRENPGGLWLAPMAPENITVPTTEPYDEVRLLADLEVALEKSKSLTFAPGEISAHSGGIIRRDYRPPPKATDQPDATNRWFWPTVGVCVVLTVSIGIVMWVRRKRRRTVG